MAISLGSIGSFFNRAVGLSNAPGTNQGAPGFAPVSGSDVANFSDEMLEGMQNPLVDSMAQTLQQVQLAQSFGADASTSLQQLQQEYQAAQSQGVALPTELQQAVEQVLSQAGLLPGLGQDPSLPGASQPGSGEGSGGTSPQAASDGGGQTAAAQAVAPTSAGGETWSQAALFDQAMANEPADFRNPEAWAQGDSAGNCSAVAVIKAATAESGNAIFESVRKTETGYVVTTQDGRTVTVSQAELAAAQKTSDFEGPDSPAKAQAVMAAGVIAKSYQSEHPGMTYQQALHATNGVYDQKSNPKAEGIYPEDAARLLGIPYSRTSVQTAVQDVKNGRGSEAAILYNGRHAEVVTGNRQGGAKVDDYGRSTNTNGQISKNGQTSQATNGIELHSKPKPKAA
ncbi:hypothetical protein ABS71_13845 [bacterium SCN 62-11]|nr:hypothetical protein [Candidatus Eremiobacteraeota bacterium]ODT63879.1 MAG: hypothetical protein ABS71_13845 [bacterium SCN 62-11]